MLKKRLAKIILFLVLAFTGFLLYNFTASRVENFAKNDSGNQSNIVSDKSHNRTIYSPEFNRTRHTDVINDSVYRGMSMTRNNDHFFVSDFGDYMVKKFDLNGIYADKIGNGNGRGPGQFLNISDLTATEDYLWTADMISMRITRFPLSSTEEMIEITTDKRPSRIAANRQFVAVKWLSSEEFFTIYNSTGEELNTFGSIDENQIINPFSYDGWIDISEEYLFFIPMYFGKIYVYDLDDGAIFKEMNTPVPTQPPKLQEDNQNGERRITAPTTQYVNSSIFYIEKNNTLAVSSYYRGDEIRKGEYDEKTAAFWIDFYDLDDWTYRDSIELPHAVSTFFFTNDTFYTYNTTSAAGRSYLMTHELLEIIY